MSVAASLRLYTPSTSLKMSSRMLHSMLNSSRTSSAWVDELRRASLAETNW